MVGGSLGPLLGSRGAMCGWLFGLRIKLILRDSDLALRVCWAAQGLVVFAGRDDHAALLK